MKRRALLVGVERYQDAAIANAGYAIHDIRALRDVFEDFGFQAQCFENPSRNKLVDAVARSTEGLERDDMFLFFFAGHGLTLRGEEVLCCADDHPGKTMGVPFAEIRAMTDKPGLHCVFLLDTSRSGIPAKFGGPEGTLREMPPLNEVVAADKRSSMVVIYACRQGQNSYAVESAGHGLFTLALIDVLRRKRQETECVAVDLDLRDSLARRMREIIKESGLPIDQEPDFMSSGESPTFG